MRVLAPADRVERGGDAGAADGQTDRAVAGRMMRKRLPPGSNYGRRWRWRGRTALIRPREEGDRDT